MFLQPNPSAWPVFWDWVQRFTARFSPQNVWDAHAGSGFLTSALNAPDIFASEPDRLAHGILQGLFVDKPEHCLHATAERVIEEGLLPFDLDAAVLDPPRSGLSSELRDWLRNAGPRCLLYFSCDMGTFARDLYSLSTRYEVESSILAMNVSPGTLRLELGVMLARE
jgi:tRNA/tmRNA/rRNA uracil-C5-methylase (TrmA/RlmC/RlmD family)